MESPHLSTMVAFYYKHFASYSRGKKHVTQLILVVMWKQIYIDYQLHHINLVFVKKTLKGHLHDTFKELKIRSSNEEGLERTTLQCDEVLKHLRATNGHATKKILKRCQSLLDGSHGSTPSTPSSNFVEPEPPMYNPNASLDYRPSTSDNDKLMTKAQMLQI
jgi:hypothetical protein